MLVLLAFKQASREFSIAFPRRTHKSVSLNGRQCGTSISHVYLILLFLATLTLELIIASNIRFSHTENGVRPKSGSLSNELMKFIIAEESAFKAKARIERS